MSFPALIAPDATQDQLRQFSLRERQDKGTGEIMTASKKASWMTTTEVADEIGYSESWVRDRIKSGQLEARRFTGGKRDSLRIARSSFQRFLDMYTE